MSQNEIALKKLQNLLAESQAARDDFFRRQSGDVVAVARLMGTCVNGGGKFLICGNGGSTSDSLHFSGEMIGRFLKERRPLPAISLSADLAALTAIGNDYGYEHTFSRGVEAFGKKGDLFFALSTSGKSPNILKAAEAAKRLGLPVIALTGGSGGPLGQMADHHLNVAEGKASWSIQETHIQVIHLLVGLMDEYFLG